MTASAAHEALFWKSSALLDSGGAYGCCVGRETGLGCVWALHGIGYMRILSQASAD